MFSWKRNGADGKWVDEHGKYIGVLAYRGQASLRQAMEERALVQEQHPFRCREIQEYVETLNGVNQFHKSYKWTGGYYI